MSIVFVDYPDGAGGEFLSYFISLHNNFYQGESISENGRQNFKSNIINYLNLQSRIIKRNTWTADVRETLITFKNLLQQKNITSICVPFHSFYNRDNQNLRDIFSGCKIIRIIPRDANSFKLIKTELIRKVIFIKYSLKDIQFYHKLFPGKIHNIKNFTGIDILLLIQHLEINEENKNKMLESIINLPVPHFEPADYTLYWEDFYKDLEKIDIEYDKLCNFLNLKADKTLLEIAKKRNAHNLNNLLAYDIKEQAKKFGFFLE